MRKFCGFFINFPRKILVVQEKVVPLHPQNRNKEFFSSKILGYGVMVTLQILVLPFLVRVRVPQLKTKNPSRLAGILCLCLILGIDCFDFLSYKIHVVLKLLHLAVHLVYKAVTLLRTCVKESEIVLVGLNL